MRSATAFLFLSLFFAASIPLISSALTASTPSSSGASCPALAHSLARGVSGSDVTALQQFLISQNLLSADSATGFFGPLTVAAVQKFQTAHQIVSSGTPQTTGFGLVGAKTRAAIAAACNGNAIAAQVTPALQKIVTHVTPKPTNASCPQVQLPIGKACSGKWKEVRDAANTCTASWQCVAK